MVILHSYVNVYHRVYPIDISITIDGYQQLLMDINVYHRVL